MRTARIARKTNETDITLTIVWTAGGERHSERRGLS